MPCTNRSSRQRGFTMIEIMAAAMVLSLFIVGVGAAWVVADRRADEVVLRQKAIFVANAEMERLSALYNYTTFGLVGGSSTAAYESSLPFPTTRLVYSSGGLSPYMTGANDYTTTSSAAFQSGSVFQVWVATSGLSSANRNYVWLDQARNRMARLSWTVSNVNPAQCTVGITCLCLNPVGIGTASCRKLDLYVEYPYRLVSGAASAEGNIRTVSLSTIVGRQTR